MDTKLHLISENPHRLTICRQINGHGGVGYTRTSGCHTVKNSGFTAQVSSGAVCKTYQFEDFETQKLRPVRTNQGSMGM